MSILLGLMIALHACWPVVGKQIRNQLPTPQNCLHALLACCAEISLLGVLLGSQGGVAAWLFAALPSSVYLAAVSIDVLTAEHS